MSYFEPKYERLYIANCSEAMRTAELLRRSIDRLKTVFPLNIK